MPRNTLYKETSRKYIPGSPGVPAHPGSPYRPAYYKTETERVCSYGVDESAAQALGWTREAIEDDKGETSLVWIPPRNGVGGAKLPYAYACRNVTKRVYVPAEQYVPPTPGTPPTPAQFVIDHKIGWTARARSIKRIQNAARATFKVPAGTTGVVVGLSVEFAQAGYQDIACAFYVSNGVASIVERGQLKRTHGVVTADTVFGIEWSGITARYSIDGDVVFSTTEPGRSIGGKLIHLDAALYTGGDRVDEPTLDGLNVGDGRLPAIAGLSSDYAFDAMSFGVLPAITGAARGGFDTPSVLPAIIGLSADRPYAESRGTLPAITGYAAQLEAHDEATLDFSVMAVEQWRAQGEILVGFMTSAGVITLASVEVSQNADMREAVRATTIIGAGGELGARIFTIVTGRQIHDLPQAGDTWVMNLENGGFTRYEEYGFTSFAKIGDSYYGCRPDGIYKLDGDTDAGNLIQAMVSFGKQDFGTSALKRITNVYVGVSSQDRLFLKVLAEGEEYIYAARAADEHLQQQRFDVGRGLRVNYLEFELYNADGSDFELASVEFAVLPTSRRI